MAHFRVEINFSTTVSEESANDLEYLVREFVESMLNVVANDDYDQDDADDYDEDSKLDEGLKPGSVVPIDSVKSPEWFN